MATNRGAAARTGSEQDDAEWGDEREVAVWGQVSARTLHLVIMLSWFAGLVFWIIDFRRYWPCVVVFLAIALGFTFYSGWAARRSGVDLRPARTVISAKWVLPALVFAAVLYLIDRFALGQTGLAGWPSAAELVAGVLIGWYLQERFSAVWKRRRALGSQQPPGLPHDDRN